MFQPRLILKTRADHCTMLKPGPTTALLLRCSLLADRALDRSLTVQREGP